MEGRELLEGSTCPIETSYLEPPASPYGYPIPMFHLAYGTPGKD